MPGKVAENGHKVKDSLMEWMLADGKRIPYFFDRTFNNLPLARFKVFIEYEGTRYSGWQIQTNARTVQGEIIRAVKKICKTDVVEFYGAGRTDAGVHAVGQVAHLDVRTMLAPEIIRMKLNDELPPDINILEVEKAPPAFHARHDALARSYLYQVSSRRSAFGKHYVWWVKDRLDVPAMEDAARLFVGMKDLRSFTDANPDEDSTKIAIEAIDVKREGDLILFRVRGSHFVWKLVRRVVGVLVEVGRGKFTRQEVGQFIREKSDAPARCTAPPSGLFLEKVWYDGDEKDPPLQPVFPVRAFHHHRRP